MLSLTERDSPCVANPTSAAMPSMTSTNATDTVAVARVLNKGI